MENIPYRYPRTKPEPSVAGPVWREGATTGRPYTRETTLHARGRPQVAPTSPNLTALCRGVLCTPAGDRRSPLHPRTSLLSVGACFARPRASAARPDKRRRKKLQRGPRKTARFCGERSSDEADKNPHPKGRGFAVAQSAATRRALHARGRPGAASVGYPN